MAPSIEQAAPARISHAAIARVALDQMRFGAAKPSWRRRRVCSREQNEQSRRWHGPLLVEARMRLILLIIIILLVLGALPTWPYSAGWGYYPSGGLGLVLLIVIILAGTGRPRGAPPPPAPPGGA